MKCQFACRTRKPCKNKATVRLRCLGREIVGRVCSKHANAFRKDYGLTQEPMNNRRHPTKGKK